MQGPVEVRCIVCHLIFCCAECRWKHEQSSHGLLYDCPICRGLRYLCRPKLLNLHFIKHLVEEHLPLQCKKCDQEFNKMEDLIYINECNSISELVDKSDVNSGTEKEVNEKFDLILEKVEEANYGENFEAIVSVDKQNKTAVITPLVRQKHIVDYESSDNEDDDKEEPAALKTPHATKLVPKTPKLKRQRAATPHVKKLLGLMRQKVVEEYEENADEVSVNKTTPSRPDGEAIPEQKEMTTPTSHLQLLTKLAPTTTSTPTHPLIGGWSLFPEQGADSPLSEIENSSPAGNATEPSKLEAESVPPKLKSIIVTGSRIKFGSQDSSEKQVTIQEPDITEASSVKTKRVQFAQDTIFTQEPKIKRVYRKPKRMLTPGPQKPKYCCNPRFQALINRFENQGLTMARTPIHNRAHLDENTPPVGEPSNMQARAINFKEDSPVIEADHSKESNELFRTCLDSSGPINNAITALTANIAGSLQNCLASALRSNGDETEIQFKFVISKKTVTVKKAAELEDEEGDVNIWSTVAKAVRNVFWRDQSSLASTPHSSYSSQNSSSASKRKCDEMTDPDFSPLNHKRHKFEGRIRGRPPLRRSKTWVSSLKSSRSAEQTLLDKMCGQDDVMNQSF